AYSTRDRPTDARGHSTANTVADLARNPASMTVTGPLRLTVTTSLPGVDGSRIGIAVLDSGIYKEHTDFLDKGNTVRVVYSKDFTGENRVDDPFGHGSHVAAIAAGNGRVSNASFLGIAPGANLVNL